MCGRFSLTSKGQRLRERFGLTEEPGEIAARYNIAPSQPVLVIPNRRQRLLRPARWGLVPQWARDPSIGHRLINVRADTLAARPAFREALERKRCVIPADGFYEWRRDGKQRRAFYVHARDGAPLAFAGLWDVWRPRDGGEPIASCTIVTTDPNELLSSIHDRMPVVLPPAAYDAWLDPHPRPAAELASLLVPYPAGALDAYEVSSWVNTPDHEGPECIAPLADPGPSSGSPS